MRVVEASLANRFYFHDGWTADFLETFLVRGGIHKEPTEGDLKFHGPGWYEKNGHMLLKVGGAFDVEKLSEVITEYRLFGIMGEGVSVVDKKTIKEGIERHNWR